MKIFLKNNSSIELQDGATAYDAAVSISEGLARNAFAAKINGAACDLSTPLNDGDHIEILTSRDEEGMEIFRHTAAHILAQAIKNIYPTAQLAIGPATATAFYYDVDFPTPIGVGDLEKIEREMAAIAKADFPITRTVLTKKQALAKMKGFGESYKVQIIEELESNAVISMYTQGNFTDLCTGPHLPSTGKVKHFKLTSIAGAYWRGDEKNKMLTRIYGAAFEKKSELEDYINALEQAKLRDHNKIGRELGIFMTDENIGQGLPLLMPKGAKILRTLIRFVEDEEERRGYLPTRTPSLAKKNLYMISGHWSHYRDGMFVMGADEESLMALRPMSCPFQFAIYKNGLKSYRDLPIRYGETATLFRNESSGEMHGLIRVRQFTLSDGHIICTQEQIENEFCQALDLVYFLLNTLGLQDDVRFRFSKWDKNNTEKYIDNPQAWETTQDIMRQILNHLGLKYTEADGEAAFYGPKLDVQIKNVYGKEDTIITLQIDFALAERFNMEYVAEDGTKKRPYIIHRSSIGCYERTLALLIEKYGGAFPTWLSPLQVVVMSLTDRTADDASKVAERLTACGVSVRVDNRAEKIGYKIREAQLEKVPYMLIVGDKEKENGVVSVRSRSGGDIGTMTLDEFIDKITKEITTRQLN